jgi:hypothetical protein
LVLSSADWVRAQAICDSDDVIIVFAASEFEELNDDGKTWVAALVKAARVQALEEAALLIEQNQIGTSNSEAGTASYLAPRYEGNREALYYAVAIRALKAPAA